MPPVTKEKTSSPREHGTPTKGVLVVALRRSLRDIVSIMDRLIDLSGSAFQLGIRVLAPCLICLAIGIIAFVIHTWFVHALPLMRGGPVGQVCVSCIGVFLVSNALYNYLRTICTSPGHPPEHTEEMERSLEGDMPKPRKCLKCGLSKPERTHHCRIMGKCVLKMDHFCPWVNNCVGFGNYRYFTLFMFFMCLSCLFIIVTFGLNFGLVLTGHMRSTRQIPRASRSRLMTSFMLCFSIFFALCMLGGFHVYLVLTNQSTIEFQTNIMKRREARKNGEFFRNPYDLGRSRNFQSVFGPHRFWRFRWCLSWLAEGPNSNGMEFPSLRVRAA